VVSDDFVDGFKDIKATPTASMSAKNSKVLDLKARANFWNISEICGGFEDPSVSVILLLFWVLSGLELDPIFVQKLEREKR